MIISIMLRNNAFLGVVLSAVLWSGTVQDADAIVIASLRPLGFITAAIADTVTPTQVLLPNGSSEHDYALRPSDVKRLQNAELVVWIGPEMEVFMSRQVSQLAAKKQVQIAALEGVKPLLMKVMDEDGYEHVHDHHDSKRVDKHHSSGEYNFHLWLSPEIARLSAVAIHDRLGEILPQKQAKLDANLKDFETQLAVIDKLIGDELAPMKGKGYYVFHDAYGYYEKYYGLTSLGHFTINPEIQPGVQRLHEIRTHLVEQKVACVFAEPQFRPAILEAVARGTSVRMGTLDPLGTNIQLSKQSYAIFLSQLANQYTNCLKGK